MECNWWVGLLFWLRNGLKFYCGVWGGGIFCFGLFDICGRGCVVFGWVDGVESVDYKGGGWKRLECVGYGDWWRCCVCGFVVCGEEGV